MSARRSYTAAANMVVDFYTFLGRNRTSRRLGCLTVKLNRPHLFRVTINLLVLFVQLFHTRRYRVAKETIIIERQRGPKYLIFRFCVMCFFFFCYLSTFLEFCRYASHKPIYLYNTGVCLY